MSGIGLIESGHCTLDKAVHFLSTRGPYWSKQSSNRPEKETYLEQYYPSPGFKQLVQQVSQNDGKVSISLPDPMYLDHLKRVFGLVLALCRKKQIRISVVKRRRNKVSIIFRDPNNPNKWHRLYKD